MADSTISEKLTSNKAGIHFSSFNHRYRAMFNFLEYPRVVIGLKRR